MKKPSLVFNNKNKSRKIKNKQIEGTQSNEQNEENTRNTNSSNNKINHGRKVNKSTNYITKVTKNYYYSHADDQDKITYLEKIIKELREEIKSIKTSKPIEIK